MNQAAGQDPQANPQGTPGQSNQGFNSYDPFDPFGLSGLTQSMGQSQPAGQAQPSGQAQPATQVPMPPQPSTAPQAPNSYNMAPGQQYPPHPNAGAPQVPVNPAGGQPAMPAYSPPQPAGQAQPAGHVPVPPQPSAVPQAHNPYSMAPGQSYPPHPNAGAAQAPVNPAGGQPAMPVPPQPLQGQHIPAPPGSFAPPAQPGAGYQPPAAGQNPQGGYAPHPNPGAAQPQQPAVPPKPANFQLGKLINLSNTLVKLQTNHPGVDTNLFLVLLAQSISLSKPEKVRIINSFPTLSLFQINELIRIFQDEKQEFAKLPEKNLPELEKLAKKHALDWESIEHDIQQEDIKKKELEAQQKLRDKFGL